MILDGQLLFTGGTTYGAGTSAIAQTITTTANSTNIIDLGPGPTNTALPPSQTGTLGPPQVTQQPFRDIGIGDDPAMKLLVQCLNSFAGGTNIAIALQGAPDNGSGAPGSFVTWYSTPTYTTAAPAQLTVGSRLMDMDMPRPPNGVQEPRFLQLAYTISGTFTGPSLLFGAIVLDRADQVYNTLTPFNNAVWGGYPAGVVVAN